MRLRRFACGPWLVALTVALAAGSTKNAWSAWDETVTIVVPYAAGGGNDIAARALANALTGKLAKSVIVENKPGAGGGLAVRNVMSSNPDGRTILLNASITEIQSAKQNPLYDVTKDLAPVILCYEGQYTLYSDADLPVKSFQDLRAYDKQNPGKLSYASFGAGSGPHLAFEWLKQLTSMTMVHVPYRSNLEAVNAVMKHDVHLSMDTYTVISPFIETEKMRALATTGKTRDKLAPNIPTLDESGVRGFGITISTGILAPLKTPKETIATLNGAINDALKDPGVIKAVSTLAFFPVGGTTGSYDASLKQRVDTYRGLISSAGITF